MKKLDFLFVALAAVLSLLPLPFLLGAGRAAAVVTVTQHGAVLYSGPVDTDAVVVTPDGGNTIIIESGCAYMAEADCPDGLCMRAGAAGAAHPVVCLPNEVIVTISEAEEDAVDAVVQ